MDSFCDGPVSAAVIAYGAPRTGKTHTMMGSADGEPGIILLAAEHLFKQLLTSGEHLHRCEPSSGPTTPQ